jgi:hypothetical protein
MEKKLDRLLELRALRDKTNAEIAALEADLQSIVKPPKRKKKAAEPKMPQMKL